MSLFKPQRKSDWYKFFFGRSDKTLTHQDAHEPTLSILYRLNQVKINTKKSFKTTLIMFFFSKRLLLLIYLTIWSNGFLKRDIHD